DRTAGRGWRSVDGVAEIPGRAAVDAVQRVRGTAADSGVGLEHILRRGASVAARHAQLPEETQGITGAELDVQIAEIGARALVGTRDLIVDTVCLARHSRERGLRQGVVGYDVTGQRRLAAAAAENVGAPQEIVVVDVGRLELRGEERPVQGEGIARLPFNIDQSTIALAPLLEEGR